MFRPQKNSEFACVWIIILLMVVVVQRGSADDVAFFYAIDADYKAFKKDAVPVGQPVQSGGRIIQRLKVAKHNVYAVKMGSGPVQTAISASALLSQFRCTMAFSVGPVGSLTEDITTNTWCRVGATIPYQKGVQDRGGSLPEAIEIPDAIKSKVEAVTFSIPKVLKDSPSITVASGEMFIASTNFREQLSVTTKAQAVDMNLFGLVCACKDFNVPLFSWRIISDYADDEAKNTFSAFVKDYDGSGGRMIAEVIRDLPVTPDSPEYYPALSKMLASPANSK